ncbi:hypothetical protein GCM10025770_22800 [Viridibacterium curvum]|uniref:SH3 domain-containing protein n=2 Tax=Viridibacterium curvum TaxID=1101404 RepID=A0ABP9QRI1_9RHOO
MLATALTVMAIVTQDQTALRAAPRDSAPQQVQLAQGESLEVRGQKGDFLQVWDHRRERGGYLRATQVRRYTLNAESAPALLAVTQFVRDTPGQEALGISHAAAFLHAAPAEAITPEAFDALGTMADRLARRASQSRGKAGDVLTAQQLEVVAAYGVSMQSFERDGQMQICYDGEAFRRVMALPKSTPEQKARAALALTRHDCVSPTLTPTERASLDAWRYDVLSRVDTTPLPEHLKNRIHMRRAGVLSAIAYQQARRNENPMETAQRALGSLAAINKSELTEDDANSYSDAAVRVGAVRWAAELPGKPASLSLTTRAGQPGETCIQLIDAKENKKIAGPSQDFRSPPGGQPGPNGPGGGASSAVFERCTWGTVWTASASVNAQRTAVTVAVQTGETWRELWLFRKGEEGWNVDVIPPSANFTTEGPAIGYIEFAGWVPGNQQILAAREVRVDGRYKRSFEILNLDSLQVARWADRFESLAAFYKWQDPRWKGTTVSVR